jgi:hypothetical protein
LLATKTLSITDESKLENIRRNSATVADLDDAAILYKNISRF